MELPPEELTFVRDLVKASRQRVHTVKWVDRDGSARATVLTAAEATRLNGLARTLGLAPAEVLRQVAFIPNAKPGAGGE